ncbi:hypothetical protein ACJZ2D_007011 [Fusarium nematophilum]
MLTPKRIDECKRTREGEKEKEDKRPDGEIQGQVAGGLGLINACDRRCFQALSVEIGRQAPTAGTDRPKAHTDIALHHSQFTSNSSLATIAFTRSKLTGTNKKPLRQVVSTPVLAFACSHSHATLLALAGAISVQSSWLPPPPFLRTRNGHELQKRPQIRDITTLCRIEIHPQNLQHQESRLLLVEDIHTLPRKAAEHARSSATRRLDMMRNRADWAGTEKSRQRASTMCRARILSLCLSNGPRATKRTVPAQSFAASTSWAFLGRDLSPQASAPSSRDPF